MSSHSQCCGRRSTLLKLFLIYIIDLTKGLFSNAKPFADDTNLFLGILNSSTSTTELLDDLTIINN